MAEHGEALGGDGRVLAGGQSSGANLVAAACLVARDRGRPLVARQVLCYPWLDLGDEPAGGAPQRSDEWYRSQYLAGQAVTPLAAPLTARTCPGSRRR